jgi:hypothetical protein
MAAPVTYPIALHMDELLVTDLYHRESSRADITKFRSLGCVYEQKSMPQATKII